MFDHPTLAALTALAHDDCPEVRALFESIAIGGSVALRAAALRGMRQVGHTPIELLTRFCRHPDPVLRALALHAGADALLLGSTPELRSLVAEHGLRLTGADIDPVFWEAMGRLGGRPDDGFIAGDWLDLPEGRTWDVILGDCALNMLPWPRMQVMIARLARMLPAGGTALFRLQAIDPTIELDTLRAAFADWPGPRTTRGFLVAHHFLVESLRNATRPELTNRAFFEAVVAELLTPDELRALSPLLRDRRNCYPPLGDLIAALEAHFEIVDRQPCLDPGAGATASFFVLSAR